MIRRLLTAFALALVAAQPALAVPVSLTILHTNDMHSHLVPYDYKGLKSIGGVAREATLVERIESQEPGRVLLLDAGDVFQGTPIFNFFHGKVEYDAFDALGYAATTVGNHDLDDGLANLELQDRDRHFLLINSNLVDPRTGKYLFTPYHLFARGGVKIGVFGVLGDQGPDDAWAAVAKVNQRGMKILDPVTVARQMAKELRAKGADVVVLLSHCGFVEDKALAARVKGIDLIVGGHSHTEVDSPVAVRDGSWTTYVTQAACYDRFLGRVDLTVDHGRLVKEGGYLIPIAGDTPADAKVAALIAPYEARIAARMDTVIGQAPQGLSVAGAWQGDSQLGDWAADLLRKGTHSEIAMINAGGLRAAISPGPVSVGDIFTVFPFDDRVVTLDMAGSLIQRQLDAVAAHKASMLDVSGMTFAVADGRATDIKVAGRPLEPSQLYTVTTVDYLAEGNDHYTFFPLAKSKKDDGMILRDAIIRGIRRHPEIVPPQLDRIDNAPTAAR